MNDKQFSGLIQPHSTKIIALARLLDVSVITATLWAVISIYAGQWAKEQTWWILISIVSFQVFAEFNDVYKENRGSKILQEIVDIFFSWISVCVILIVVDYFIPLIDPVYRSIFIYWIALVPVEVVSWHIIVSNVANILRKSGRNSRSVVILGANRLGLELEKVFKQEAHFGFNFQGFYDDRQKDGDGRKLLKADNLLGNINDLIEQAKIGQFDYVFITLALSAEKRIKHVIEQLSDSTVSVYYVPNLFAFDLLRSSMNFVGGIPVVSIHDTPFIGIDGLAKRLFDIVISIIILIMIAIPCALIALGIKLTSPGKVIFKQRRYGFKGEKIVVWKFRSMTVMEDGKKIEQAHRNDPRITPFGKFLRATSLDELPQFFNVLQGRMSIVGPRPHAVAHNELYRGQIQGYMLRHKVKPGITGLAQVNGFRGETDTLDKMEGRIRYDLEYIRNWSIWMDVKIIFRTILMCFFKPTAF